MKAKRHIDFDGIPLLIQQWPGEKHEGHRVVGAAYGLIQHTRGADEMNVDCFLGPNRTSRNVYIVEAVDGRGQFKQLKCFLGFGSARQAERVFERTYKNDPSHHVGAITQMDMLTFKSWLNAGGGRHPISVQENDAAEYQAGGAIESAAAEPTPAQSFFGDYLESAHHLFGSDGVDTFMGHYRGGAVPGSSSA